MTIFKKSAFIPTVAASVGSIGKYTSAASAGPLVLNGTLVNATGEVSFVQNGYSSSVSITCGFNISVLNFTIIGTFAGMLISEVITAPNANTVTTNNLFDSVTSIIISGVTIRAFTIDSNVNTAVILNNNFLSSSNKTSNSIYSILLNSRTAAGNWAAGSAVIYGVADTVPTLLQANALVNITTYNNFFALFGASAVITQAQLNSGTITQTTYPYTAIIVYLAAGINTTPAFIEITQS